MNHSLEIRTAERIDRWVKWFRELISFRSEYGCENGIVAYVEQIIKDIGFSAISIPFDPKVLACLPDAQPPIALDSNRRNLVVKVPGVGNGRSLALNCHLDVVSAGEEAKWTYPPFDGSIDPQGEFIFGRGAMDDKAGVVICLAVLDMISTGQFALPGDLLVHFVLEDEVTGNGTLLCLEAGHGADSAIIVDGTRPDRGINAHAGNCRFGISIKGSPASVSVSHLGINAGEHLIRLLLRLKDEIHGWNRFNVAPWDQFPSPNQFVMQTIRCSGDALTVPTAASATCYVTFTPAHSLTTLRSTLEESAHDYATRCGLPERPTFDWSYFAAEPAKSDAGELEEILRCVARSAFGSIQFGPSTGTSDLRHFALRGIPTVLYGPGFGFNPHRADERYRLADLPKMTALLLSAAHLWMSAGNQLRD